MLLSRISLSARLILLLGLLLFASGCGRAVNRSAERHIRDELPEIVGPARQYRVHVSGDESHTAQGHLEAVAIDGDDVQMNNGLLLDQLHLDLKNVDVDLHHKQLHSVESARFVATIGEASLDEFLAGETPEGETIRNAHITLHDNTVTLTAERVVLGAGVPFRATGPLKLRDSQHLELDPNRLVVVGIPITGVALRFLKERFESAIDLTRLSFPLTLTSVQTAKGKLILTGSADVVAMTQDARIEKQGAHSKTR